MAQAVRPVRREYFAMREDYPFGCDRNHCLDRVPGGGAAKSEHRTDVVGRGPSCPSRDFGRPSRDEWQAIGLQILHKSALDERAADAMEEVGLGEAEAARHDALVDLAGPNIRRMLAEILVDSNARFADLRSIAEAGHAQVFAPGYARCQSRK
jgi:hypothetical protein